MRTRVKICGITRVEDAQAAVRAGADAIGIVFDTRSPRYVAPARAAEIARVAGAFVSVVGLFVDAEPERIRATLNQVPLSLLQFHGSETPDQCRVYKLPYIKAVRMQDSVDVRAQASAHVEAAALLLDTYDAGVAGGSGQAFDWTRVPRDLSKPVILAGGLRPETVAAAIKTARPYAVDVSSGVESAKGIKDTAKIEDFVRAVMGAS